MPTEADIFEKDMCLFFSKERGVTFKKGIVKFKGAKHSFDLISDDGKYIGDAKFYSMRSNGGVPQAKLSTVSEYVWLLEKTKAKHKFLVFGQDSEVSTYWLKKYGCLTDVKFYFFKNNKLKKWSKIRKSYVS